MPHGEVALLRDTLRLSLFQGSQETDLCPVDVHAEVYWGSVSDGSGRGQNQVEGGIGHQDSPSRGCADLKGAVSKKPCRGVWKRNKGIRMATSCSMQVAPGDSEGL